MSRHDLLRLRYKRDTTPLHEAPLSEAVLKILGFDHEDGSWTHFDAGLSFDKRPSFQEIRTSIWSHGFQVGKEKVQSDLRSALGIEASEISDGRDE